MENSVKIDFVAIYFTALIPRTIYLMLGSGTRDRYLHPKPPINRYVKMLAVFLRPNSTKPSQHPCEKENMPSDDRE
jgi:hypothetical protein